MPSYWGQLGHPGYIFCMELMPPNHQLQLMLVNTLRKVSDAFSVGCDSSLMGP